MRPTHRNLSIGRQPDKAFHRFILGQTQLVIESSRRGVTLFGSVPEFADIGSRKERSVLLRLMLENRVSLASDFLRAQWHGHFDLIWSSFVPGSAIEPDFRISVSLFVYRASIRSHDGI